MIKICVAMTASAVICAGAVALFGSPSSVVTMPYVETAAINTSNTTVGFADSDLYGMTPADIDRTLDEMQAMGVQNVRILIPWAGVEPVQDFYYWDTVDYLVNAAYERTMGILTPHHRGLSNLDNPRSRVRRRRRRSTPSSPAWSPSDMPARFRPTRSGMSRTPTCTGRRSPMQRRTRSCRRPPTRRSRRQILVQRIRRAYVGGR
jgi:hypothetical protein